MKDKTPHKHSEVIKAWADGETIQIWAFKDEEWITVNEPIWRSEDQYRVKPKDTILYTYIPLVKFLSDENIKDGFDVKLIDRQLGGNLKLYFNESGELSKAEVIS